jgi:hypothetical protein
MAIGLIPKTKTKELNGIPLMVHHKEAILCQTCGANPYTCVWDKI